MEKKILKSIALKCLWALFVWLLVICVIRGIMTTVVITSEDIQEYMNATDFYLAGKVTLIKDDAGSRGLYMMEYDTISIRNKSIGRCFWGVCDTAAKSVFFHSYTLNSDYVYIDSKKRLITANPADTVSMVKFRVFDILFRQLREYQGEGTIPF
ncbi:MAG: hypothetical protein IK131_06755 [Paludibacteraceae bacterium]|nr:hypothetical protein [Paludibacteraceae bacterium]